MLKMKAVKQMKRGNRSPVNLCVVCGKIEVPEGSWVCWACQNQA